MTMNDIPQAPTTWCDPDDVGAPLPETDEVEADPQTVQIPPAESFEVLRRASEEELRAQERGEQLNPLESGRAAITIALTPLCQLEGAVMLGVSLLEAVAKRVEQVDEDAVEAYLPDWLFDHDNLTAADVPGLLVERVRRDLADPVVVSTMGEEAVEQLRSGLSAILAAQRHDAAEFSRHVNPDVDPSGSLTAVRRSVSLWPPMPRPSAGSALRSMSPTSLPALTWLASPTSSVPC